MNPTEFAALVGIGGVVVGSIVTGFFGLIGPTIQSRREHRKWLRESRLVAYGDLLTAFDAWMNIATTRAPEARALGKPDEFEALNRQAGTLEDEASRAQSRVVLLGPDPVRIVASGYHHLLLDYVFEMSNASSIEELSNIDNADLTAQRGLLLGVMNRVLGIGPS